MDTDEVASGLERIEEELGFNPASPLALDQTGFHLKTPGQRQPLAIYPNKKCPLRF